VKALILTLSTLFLANLAYAYPKVGDYIQVLGSERAADGSTVDSILELEIVSMDSRTGRVDIKTTQEAAGQKTVSMRESHIDDMYTPDMMKTILKNCAKMGGVYAPVDVVAGRFNACTLVDEREPGHRVTYVYADVPFGLAQMIEERDGGVRHFQLAKIRRGN